LWGNFVFISLFYSGFGVLRVYDFFTHQDFKENYGALGVPEAFLA